MNDHLYNCSYDLSQSAHRKPGHSVVQVVNDSNEVIFAGNAVAAGETVCKDHLASEVIFAVSNAPDGDSFRGIAGCTMEPGCRGFAVVCGAAFANVSGSVCAGDRLVPKAGLFMRNQYGSVLALSDGNDEFPAVVLLGGATAAEPYKGEFAVELLEGNNFRVYDSVAPESTVAGHTDIPTFKTSGIPVAIVPVPESRELYINFVYDEAAGAYTYSFSGTAVRPLSTRLAYLRMDGIMVQDYTSNNGLNYSREYFL